MLMLKLSAPSSLKCEVGILFSYGVYYVLTNQQLIHFDPNNYVSVISIHYYKFYSHLFFCFTVSLMRLRVEPLGCCRKGLWDYGIPISPSFHKGWSGVTYALRLLS